MYNYVLQFYCKSVYTGSIPVPASTFADIYLRLGYCLLSRATVFFRGLHSMYGNWAPRRMS